MTKTWRLVELPSNMAGANDRQIMNSLYVCAIWKSKASIITKSAKKEEEFNARQYLLLERKTGTQSVRL